MDFVLNAWTDSWELLLESEPSTDITRQQNHGIVLPTVEIPFPSRTGTWGLCNNSLGLKFGSVAHIHGSDPAGCSGFGFCCQDRTPSIGGKLNRQQDRSGRPARNQNHGITGWKSPPRSVSPTLNPRPQVPHPAQSLHFPSKVWVLPRKYFAGKEIENFS